MVINGHLVHFSYKNKPFMTFDDVGSECDQEIELIADPEGLIVYPLK